MENTTCSIEECTNKRLRVSTGWCGTHYQNHQRTGDPMSRNLPKKCEICNLEYTPQRSNQKYCSLPCSRKSERDKLCSTEGCADKARWGGRCANHGRKIHRAKPTSEGTCKHCGETTLFTSTRKTYCSRSCAAKDLHQSGKGGKRPLSKLGQAYADRDVDRFNSELLGRCEVSEDGCWLWMGKVNGSGYATMAYSTKRFLVHRISYELSNGAGLGVMDAHHVCGISRCVNPSHIQPATRASNIAEMKARNSYERRIAELEKKLLEASSK